MIVFNRQRGTNIYMKYVFNIYMIDRNYRQKT